MPESERPKNFVDKMFDGMESVVGGLEKSRDLSSDSDIEKDNAIDAEFTEKKEKAKLIWGYVTEYHVFESFNPTAICSRTFEPKQITERKTEMDGTRVICCGDCLRSLHSKYVNG